jgi:hypothetical protein
MWISQQIMEDNVVRNYLDCGLDDFGLSFNERMQQMNKEATHQDND